MFRERGPEPGGDFLNVQPRTGDQAGTGLRVDTEPGGHGHGGASFPSALSLSPKSSLIFTSQTLSHFQTLTPTTSSLRLSFLMSGGNCACTVSGPWQVWNGNHWPLTEGTDSAPRLWLCLKRQAPAHWPRAQGPVCVSSLVWPLRCWSGCRNTSKPSCTTR